VKFLQEAAKSACCTESIAVLGVKCFKYVSRLTYVQSYNSKGLDESFPLTRLNISIS